MHSRKVSGSDPAPALSGQISRVSIADLLSTLEARGRSAVVRFSTPSGPASVWFTDGRLIDAEMGVLSGEPALYRILGLSQGTFEVASEDSERPRLISGAVSTLVAKRSRRAARWEDLVFGGPALDEIPTRGAKPPPDPLEPDDKKLVRLIDGRRSLLEILDESRLDPVQALEALGRLQQDGHFSIERLSSSRPPPPRPGPSAPREARSSRPGRTSSEPAPSTTSTFVGLSAQTPVPPSDGRPSLESISLGERQRVATLIGRPDPSWLEPPAGRPGSNPPDSAPSIVVGSVPDESGLTEIQLRAGRDRAAADPERRPPSDWPKLEVTVDRQSAPPQSGTPGDGTNRRSVPPSFAPPSTGLSIPGVVIGSYQVLFRLAQGPASSVYLCREAEHGSVRHLFALKLFEAESGFQGAFDRFSAAARQVEALAHPNVARVLGSGAFETRSLIVSEYIEGCSLSALLKRYSRARPIPLVLAILFDAMRGVQAAHEFAGPSGAPLGLVHGNLCSRDLLLGLDGSCRVADFGASHALRAIGLIEPGRNPGKLGYAAPERQVGGELDARADVFSLGAILFEALTGVEPFGAPTAEGGWSRQLDRSVEPPSRVGCRPPQNFDAVCLRALARDPERRFGSVREFLLALEEVALEHDTLAGSAEVAGWIAAGFGRELELRRLSILDASRRSRGNSRSPGSAPPPPVSAPERASPSLPGPHRTSAVLDEPGVPEPAKAAIVRHASPALELSELDLSQPPAPRRSFPTWVAVVALLLLGSGAAAWSLRSAPVERPVRPSVLAPARPVVIPRPEPPEAALPAQQETARAEPPPGPTPSAAAAPHNPSAESAPSRNDPVSKKRESVPRVRRSHVDGSPEAIVDPAAKTGQPSAPEEEQPTPAPEEVRSAPNSAPKPPGEGEDSEFRYGI